MQFSVTERATLEVEKKLEPLLEDCDEDRGLVIDWKDIE